MKREIYVGPVRGQPIQEPQPIEGASVGQLTELLEGFTVEAKIDGKQLLFVRQLDDHRQLVYCTIDEANRIMQIEAFVGAVDEGADTNELNQQLWSRLAQLEYKDSDPEKVIAFLTGPMPNYAVDAGRAVGRAVFSLPFFADGRRSQLAIWACEPEKKPVQ